MMPENQRLRLVDEPQYADRDQGRIRLHRCGLPAMDEEAGFTRTSVEHLAGPDSHGHRYQVDAISFDTRVSHT